VNTVARTNSVIAIARSEPWPLMAANLRWNNATTAVYTPARMAVSRT
jgi:hypothetical protein